MTTGPVRANAPSQVDQASVQSVSASLSDTVLLAANSLRRGVIIVNDQKAGTAILYLKFGSGASVTSFSLPLNPNGVFLMMDMQYTGPINAVWDVATGAARVTELVQ